MHWLQSNYTARYNRGHAFAGHLVQGRYKALVVEAEAGSYFVALSDYIHLNPVRAGIVDPAIGGRLADYRWNSYLHGPTLFSDWQFSFSWKQIAGYRAIDEALCFDQAFKITTSP